MGGQEPPSHAASLTTKKRKIKETPDLTVNRRKYKMDLLPPPLVIERFFADQQAGIESLRLSQESAARRLDEFVEEHSDEDGFLKGGSQR